MQPALRLVEDRRAIIDRRAIAERIAALPDGRPVERVTAILHEALESGPRGNRAAACREPGARARGRACYRVPRRPVAAARLRPRRRSAAIGASAERRMALVGLGGTGRGEMAPFSDVDLMFLVADPPTPKANVSVEATLYLLWDLELEGRPRRPHDRRS